MNVFDPLRAGGKTRRSADDLFRFVGEGENQDARSAKRRPGLRNWRCTAFIQVRIHQHQVRMPLGQGLGGVSASYGAGASGNFG